MINMPEVSEIQYMFLVGGFSESELLQKQIRDTFGHKVNVIIPQVIHHKVLSLFIHPIIISF